MTTMNTELLNFLLGALVMLTLVLVVLLSFAASAIKWCWRWVRTHHELSSKASGGVVEVSAKLGDQLTAVERRDPHKTVKSNGSGGWFWSSPPKELPTKQEGQPS